MSEWVNCPICGDCDMEKTKDGDEGHIIHCTNLECASNGGENAEAFLKGKTLISAPFKGSALEESFSTPPMRVVVQLSSAFTADGRYFVLALCNDGTIWKLHGLYEGDPKWESFPIPPLRDP